MPSRPRPKPSKGAASRTRSTARTAKPIVKSRRPDIVVRTRNGVKPAARKPASESKAKPRAPAKAAIKPAAKPSAKPAAAKAALPVQAKAAKPAAKAAVKAPAKPPAPGANGHAARPVAKVVAKPATPPARPAAAARPSPPAAKPAPLAPPTLSGITAKLAAARGAAPPPPTPAPATSAPPAGQANADDRFTDVYSVSGQVYQKGKLVPGALHVDARTGRITKVAKSTTLKQHLDCGSAAILPGAIDIHVHFRDPGHVHKEDLQSGSIAAAFGGVTGFVDMPNTIPATTTLRSAKEKLASAAAKSVVDYGIWAAGTWFIEDLPQMLKLCVGVKAYLGSSTGDLLLEDITRLQAIFQMCATANRPVALHCEAQRVLQGLRRTEGTLEDHDLARPPLAEVEAIYDAMKAVASIKKPPRIHIAHVASADAVQAANAAKFSMGVCPHHLLLDTDVGLSHAYGKMNPPLRSPAQREALWSAFASGAIPIVESDHAPHTKAEKEDNFHAAPSGVPGVETMVPLMLAQAAAQKVDLALVVDAMTRAPAELIGAKDRGSLEAGLRADFAVFDLKKATKVDTETLHSKCGWSPFVGQKAVFPGHTFSAGRPVVLDRALVAKPGSGRSILPQPKE